MLAPRHNATSEESNLRNGFVVLLGALSVTGILTGCANQSKFPPALPEEQFQQFKTMDYCGRAGVILATAAFAKNVGFTLEQTLQDPTIAKMSNDVAERHGFEDLVVGVYQDRPWQESTFAKNIACARDKSEMVETARAVTKKLVNEAFPK